MEEQCSAAAEDRDRQSQHRDDHHGHHSEHAQQWQHGTTLLVCAKAHQQVVMSVSQLVSQLVQKNSKPA